MPNISYGIQTYYRTNTLLHTDLNSLNQFWIKFALLSFDCISWKTETCQDNFFFSLSLSVLQKVCTSALSSLWAGIWNCLAVPSKTLEAIWQGSDAIPGRLKESFSTSSISTDAHRNVHTTFSTEGAVTEPVPQEGTRHLQDLKPGWFCHRLPCCAGGFWQMWGWELWAVSHLVTKPAANHGAGLRGCPPSHPPFIRGRADLGWGWCQLEKQVQFKQKQSIREIGERKNTHKKKNFWRRF